MRKLLIGLCALLIGGALVVNDAEAKRFGGARSSGVQRNVTNTPPASVPAKPGQQQAAPAGQQAAPAAGAAAAAPASGFAKWAPLLGGLAIGGLLGSMFGGHLGGLGGILLIALLAIGAVMVFKMFARRREEGAPQHLQYAGMNERGSVPPSVQAAGTAAAPAAQAAGRASVPAGFDDAAFLRAAKLNFVKLQVANDAGQLDEIREFTTGELFEELSRDVRERGGVPQQTDVISLNAEMLGVATEGDKHWASVRFSGLVRDTPGTEPEPFQEVWNLAKPADGSSGWLLAGIQQMQ
jgi:predicted lipid-binding transport protein (Tim44 family)